MCNRLHVPEKIAAMAHVLTPYLESQETRLAALSGAYEKVDNLVKIINGALLTFL